MADEQQDFFKLLGVARDATHDDIKKAFRRLARKYHPDTGSDAEERFKEVQAAYDELRDPEKRAQYEKELENRERLEQRRGEQARRRQARAPSEDAANLFGEHVRNPHAGGGTFFPPPSFHRSASARTRSTTPTTSQPRTRRWYESFELAAAMGVFGLLIVSSAFAVGCVAVTGWLSKPLEASASGGDNLLAALALLGVGLGGFVGSIAGALVAICSVISLALMGLKRFWRFIGLAVVMML